MKRYMELIHMILHYTEENATGKPLMEPSYNGYTPEQIRYHIELCSQAGYLQVQESGKRRRILNLTWKGQEELERSRDG